MNKGMDKSRERIGSLKLSVEKLSDLYSRIGSEKTSKRVDFPAPFSPTKTFRPEPTLELFDIFIPVTFNPFSA